MASGASSGLSAAEIEFDAALFEPCFVIFISVSKWLNANGYCFFRRQKKKKKKYNMNWR